MFTYSRVSPCCKDLQEPCKVLQGLAGATSGPATKISNSPAGTSHKDSQGSRKFSQGFRRTAADACKLLQVLFDFSQTHFAEILQLHVEFWVC